VDKAQRTVLAACFLVLLAGGLWSRLTPVEVDGTACAVPPTELTSECFDAEGDRAEIQIAVSGAVLAGAFTGVRVIGRRRRGGREPSSGGRHPALS
jgi:hypothetical protein